MKITLSNGDVIDIKYKKSYKKRFEAKDTKCFLNRLSLALSRDIDTYSDTYITIANDISHSIYVALDEIGYYD